MRVDVLIRLLIPICRPPPRTVPLMNVFRIALILALHLASGVIAQADVTDFGTWSLVQDPAHPGFSATAPPLRFRPETSRFPPQPTSAIKVSTDRHRRPQRAGFTSAPTLTFHWRSIMPGPSPTVRRDCSASVSGSEKTETERTRRASRWERPMARRSSPSSERHGSTTSTNPLRRSTETHCRLPRLHRVPCSSPTKRPAAT